MKYRVAVGLLLMTLGVVQAGPMFEWRDPATGRLQLSDQPPPAGVRYWVEGHRPGEGAVTPPASPKSRPGIKTTTVAGYVACRSAADLELVVAAANGGDRRSFAALVNGARCVEMKDGVVVTLIDSPGFFGRRASFMVSGVVFYTVRQGLNIGVD